MAEYVKPLIILSFYACFSLELLSQKQQLSDLRKYFSIWKHFARQMKLYRKCMAEFPAWISSLTIKEQIAHLEKPQAISKTVAKFSKYF
jgi:hypothetical protein